MYTLFHLKQSLKFRIQRILIVLEGKQQEWNKTKKKKENYFEKTKEEERFAENRIHFQFVIEFILVWGTLRCISAFSHLQLNAISELFDGVYCVCCIEQFISIERILLTVSI